MVILGIVLLSFSVNSNRYCMSTLMEYIPSLLPCRASKFSDFSGNKSSFLVAAINVSTRLWYNFTI